MKIGFIGLGKMGAGLVQAAQEHGITVSTWNRSPHPLANKSTLEELVSSLDPGSRVIWLMVPAGSPVDEMLQQLSPLLVPGDLIIDGGNSNYQDDLRRSANLSKSGILYMDVGVSGGPAGARTGACLMIGGDQQKYQELSKLWQALAAPDSYQYLGTIGSGHFAKMVHNGIEYGMMQAIAEGVAVLHASPFNFDLAKVLDLYNHNSVIQSRLVEWTRSALLADPNLSQTSSVIDHTGEGEWTVNAAAELGIAVPIIQESLEVRKRSSQEPENFRNKLVSAMRGQFGGHKVTK